MTEPAGGAAGGDGAEPPRDPRGPMNWLIDFIELVAAAFIGIVAADIFISVMLRYLTSDDSGFIPFILRHLGPDNGGVVATALRSLVGLQIPDAYDVGRLLLGILIFWGIAATSYRGTHITVDLLYANVGPRFQRFIDVFATLVLLFIVSVQTYTLYDKVWTTRADHVLTFDLRLPVWPFYLVAWLGDISAVLLIAIRTYRLIFQPREFGAQYQIKPVE
jgi:TRAP-type C4-dicarboxylate transport system permease small subunit